MQVKLYGEDDTYLNTLTKGSLEKRLVLGHLHFRTDYYSAFTAFYVHPALFFLSIMPTTLQMNFRWLQLGRGSIRLLTEDGA